MFGTNVDMVLLEVKISNQYVNVLSIEYLEGMLSIININS